MTLVWTNFCSSARVTPFRTALPFRGQITWNLTQKFVSVQRSSKRVKWRVLRFSPATQLPPDPDSAVVAITSVCLLVINAIWKPGDGLRISPDDHRSSVLVDGQVIFVLGMEQETIFQGCE